VTSSKSQSLTVKLSLAAVFAALVTVSTLILQIPVPATGGYINVGDAMIFTCALLFGSRVGGLAGGIGSAAADLIGYPVFAPYTLLIKGVEGFVTGYVKDGKSIIKDLVAWIIGSIVMVSGYFITEAYVMGLGPVSAAVEIPGNVFQVVFGGIISIPLSRVLRKSFPSILAS